MLKKILQPPPILWENADSILCDILKRIPFTLGE
jgi:hypothetical protein